MNFLTLIFILTFLVTLSVASVAETAYRIVFKNGSSITVESYRRIDGRIQFYRAGGIMEVDGSEVLEIKEVPSTVTGATKPGGEVTGEAVESPPAPEVNEEELRLRLEEIQKEKEVLKKEADSVMEEVEKLNQEIRREGRVLAIRKKRELEKKREELENRVSDINRRIEELNREEETLLRRLWRY